MADRQFEIVWTKSPNYSTGRNGRTIIAIVNHITAGLMPECLSWLRNPAAKASTHYLVTKTGAVYQLVQDDDSAWHAGAVRNPTWRLYDGSNPNRYTIGIEHEALAGESLTEKQYQATLWLHKQLLDKWDIPVDRDRIIGHNELDTVNRPNDPGKLFPWDTLIKDLRNGVIDVSLDKWMIDGGQAALKYLESEKLVFNAGDWSKEEKLGAAAPQYLFWMMLQRLVERMEGK